MATRTCRSAGSCCTRPAGPPRPRPSRARRTSWPGRSTVGRCPPAPRQMPSSSRPRPALARCRRPSSCRAASLAAAALAVVWSCPQAKGGAPPSRPATTPSVSSAPAKLVRPALLPARRDPVLPPLVEQAAWREWLLSVRLNGQAVSLGGLFVEAPDGTLAAQLALLDAWRVRIDGARVITFQGAPYYPLQAIPGATYQLDRDALDLALEIPPDLFSRFVAAPG